VLAELATRLDADQVLLGHTLDDQAETVLLGLARGSGGRSLSGMRRSFDVFRRPLLDVTRADTETACVTEGIEFWTDPHNSDEQFARVVRCGRRCCRCSRSSSVPALRAPSPARPTSSGPTTSYLDAVADAALGEAVTDGGLAVERLSRMDVAVRGRVLRLAAVAAARLPASCSTSTSSPSTAGHDTGTGRRASTLPGHVRAVRAGDVLGFERGVNR
jgi:tRNA(Ile)-lysidine synthase